MNSYLPVSNKSYDENNDETDVSYNENDYNLTAANEVDDRIINEESTLYIDNQENTYKNLCFKTTLTASLRTDIIILCSFQGNFYTFVKKYLI
jgi:hypothetical protein